MARTETEYGVRFGNKDTWYSSKSEAEAAIRRMNKNTKKGQPVAKLIQRTVKKTVIRGRPKDKCSGGKCKRGNVCKKHFREMSSGRGNDWSLDGIHARWDEKGHRWS